MPIRLNELPRIIHSTATLHQPAGVCSCHATASYCVLADATCNVFLSPHVPLHILHEVQLQSVPVLSNRPNCTSVYSADTNWLLSLTDLLGPLFRHVSKFLVRNVPKLLWLSACTGLERHTCLLSSTLSLRLTKTYCGRRRSDGASLSPQLPCC